MVQGSVGEADFLSKDEKATVTNLTRMTLDKAGFEGVLVLAGAGAQSTWETISRCYDARRAGASHAVVLPPSVWPPLMEPEIIKMFYRHVCLQILALSRFDCSR